MGRCSWMLGSQKIHEQERAFLCLADPPGSWVIFQILWAFCDTYLAQELVVLGSQPSWHMDPMEKTVWSQRTLVRILGETGVERRGQMEGEEGVLRTHPLEYKKWVSLEVAVLQSPLSN